MRSYWTSIERAALGGPPVLPVGDAVLGLEDLLGLSGERRLQTHESVSVLGLGDGVASVECFDPIELVRCGGAPRGLARSEGYAVDGHLVGQGQGGDFGHGLTACPTPPPRWRSATRAPRGTRGPPGTPRAGTHRRARNRRWRRAAGSPRVFEFAVLRLHHHQLGGGVVVEEGVVMGGLEQVARFVGGAARGAFALQDLRTRRDGGRFGRCAPLGHAANQQALLVRRPAHWRAEERAEGHVLDLL